MSYNKIYLEILSFQILLRLQPRDIWIYTQKDFDFTSQETSLTNEGWFELEFVFTGWLNNVPCMEIIRTNTGVCPQ
jgi:hypothetical protein